MLKPLRYRCLVLLLIAIPLAGCTAGVMLVEAFTDIDEHIVSELRRPEHGHAPTYSNWYDDDALRFPEAAVMCQHYGDMLNVHTGQGALEKSYIKAMKHANCRASR